MELWHIPTCCHPFSDIPLSSQWNLLHFNSVWRRQTQYLPQKTNTNWNAAIHFKCLTVNWCLIYFSPGDFGVFLKEGSGLHEGHTDIPPLEGGQQKVWSDLPEPSWCQSFWPWSAKGPGGPDRRYRHYRRGRGYLYLKYLLSPSDSEIQIYISSEENRSKEWTGVKISLSNMMIKQLMLESLCTTAVTRLFPTPDAAENGRISRTGNIQGSYSNTARSLQSQLDLNSPCPTIKIKSWRYSAPGILKTRGVNYSSHCAFQQDTSSLCHFEIQMNSVFCSQLHKWSVFNWWLRIMGTTEFRTQFRTSVFVFW